jgi:hypothetical protein
VFVPAIVPRSSRLICAIDHESTLMIGLGEIDRFGFVGDLGVISAKTNAVRPYGVG